MGGGFVRLSKAIRMKFPLTKPINAEESIASTRTTTGDVICATQDPVKPFFLFFVTQKICLNSDPLLSKILLL
jgi:hypothetical protein